MCYARHTCKNGLVGKETRLAKTEWTCCRCKYSANKHLIDHKYEDLKCTHCRVFMCPPWDCTHTVDGLDATEFIPKKPSGQ